VATVEYKYLDPESLSRLKNLSLAARRVVEGFFAGMHRSPHRGFSVEFAEHREYSPGMDPRHVDWRVFGRRDKLYVKQYEEETNLRCYVLLDKSASMSYQHGAKHTKLEYGCYLAASLAYLMAFQHDSVGLITYDSKVRDMVPPRQGPGHLRALMEKLEHSDAGGETKLSLTFHELAERIKRRALIVVISDLFDDPEELIAALKHFRHKKHEVIVLHTLDPSELTFPFDDNTLFRGLEEPIQLHAEPRALRRSYLEAVERFLADVRRTCASAGI